MRHNNLALMAVSKEPNPTVFQKTLAMNDWYLGADDWDYPLGGIQMLGKSDAEQIRANAPRWAGEVSPGVPFEVLAHHAVDFWLCGEDLPLPDSRVTLDSDDRIHLAIDEKNNIEGLKRLRHKLEGMLGDLGMHEHLLDHSIYMHKAMPIGATAHQAGTVRFGIGPGHLSPRRELQGTRPGQPLRRRHQLLPEHRRREPVADRDRERAAGRRPSARKAGMSDMATQRMDALVIFGATGDLAKLETFPALVGLVERGVLDVPVIGVAKSGWGLDQFRAYAAESMTNNGIDPKSDAAAGLLKLLDYVDGDLDDPATYEAMSEKLPPDARTLFYLEVPPPLFGRIADGIAGAGTGRERARDGGEAVRHRPQECGGTERNDAQGLPRGRDLPRRPLARPGPGRQPRCSPGSPTRSSNRCSTAIRCESIQITMAEAFDVADRGAFYDRDRRHPRRRPEPHAAGAGHCARRPAERAAARIRGGRRRHASWTRSSR